MINQENKTDAEHGEVSSIDEHASSEDQSDNQHNDPEEVLDLQSVDQLQAALAAMETKADDHWQRYLRTAAEMENVRKRATRDVEKAHKYGQEKIAGDVLNVLDSLAMGLDAAKENATVESLIEGSEATLRLLQQVLLRHGVTEINPEGQAFNPELHEAMTTIEAPGVEANMVVQVIQPGYEINGRLLRAARVLVSKDPA